jgi:hypothetical protein
MSAPQGKTDVPREPGHFDQNGPGARLFNHLIRGGKQRRRDRQTEPLGGLEVDDKVILRRRLYRQVRWFGAAKDTIDVTRRASPLPDLDRSPANEAAPSIR